MRRPALHRPTSGWMHPYTGPLALAVFHADGGDPTPPPAPTATEPPKPAPPAIPTVSMTQDELNALAAKEKSQGERAGARKALEKFAADNGFTTVEDAQAFIEAARNAQQAALSEEERRRQELEQREQALAQREAAAIARERAAIRKAALGGLGAHGDDLADALAILERDLAATPDADEATVTAAAEALKERRPALFGATPAHQTTLPPAPGGAPAGGGTPRQPATKDDVKARAEARARQMGFRRDAA